MPAQIKEIAVKQAALEKKQATSEGATNAKLDCLQKAITALKANVTQVYTAQNTQEARINGSENVIAHLQTAVTAQQQPPAYQEQTAPPYQEDNRSNCAS